MNYIRGCHTLVMVLVLVVLIGSSSSSSWVAGQDQDQVSLMVEISSRDEVVEMAGYGEEKLSTVLITGSVNCQPRSHNGDQPHAWPIPGAWVGVHCHSSARERKGKSMVVASSVTDEFGDFMVDLPSHLHSIPNLEKVCIVKVHRIPKASLCQPSHVKKLHKGGVLELSSFGNGIRTYDAGNIRILLH